MRTIWNGSISFGLVNIPVGLALATAPKAKQSDISFRTLHRECKTPIGNKRFVKLGEVDPVYLDRTYYLAPATAPAARRPYVLLLEAMRQSEMGAIGRFVLRGAEYFCLIRPKGEALALETLFLAEDVRSQVEIDEAVAGTEVRQPELELAAQVMQSLVGDFEPSELHSEYRRDLRALLEAKLAGEEITAPAPAEPTAPVVDLMEALRASVAEAQQASKGKKSPAKKTK